jgi:predicted kinase
MPNRPGRPATTARLTLIRGLPGSGKSTMAKRFPGLHVEADMFHIKDGQYCFDRESVGIAHAWCRSIAEKALSSGCDVVVSNTFTQKWEMDPYFELAREYDAIIDVITATGHFESVHSVPVEVYESMVRRWEAYPK